MHIEIWGTADEAVLNDVNKKIPVKICGTVAKSYPRNCKNVFFLLRDNTSKLVFPNVRQGISQIIFRNDSCLHYFSVCEILNIFEGDVILPSVLDPITYFKGSW